MANPQGKQKSNMALNYVPTAIIIGIVAYKLNDIFFKVDCDELQTELAKLQAKLDVQPALSTLENDFLSAELYAKSLDDIASNPEMAPFSWRDLIDYATGGNHRQVAADTQRKRVTQMKQQVKALRIHTTRHEQLTHKNQKHCRPKPGKFGGR